MPPEQDLQVVRVLEAALEGDLPDALVSGGELPLDLAQPRVGNGLKDRLLAEFAEAQVGEPAAVEIHLVGAVKGPWLEYGTRDGVRRLNLPDGKAGARVKFQGPVLSGVRPLAFGCADPDTADVRIEIVKRYTDRPAADEPPAFVAVKEPTKWDLLAERLERDMKANGFDADEIRRTKARLLVE